MKVFLALVLVVCASWSFAQSGGPRPLEDDFLDRPCTLAANSLIPMAGIRTHSGSGA